MKRHQNWRYAGQASFEPQLIGKHERRLTGFDDKIIAMYARGMTVSPFHDECMRAIADGIISVVMPMVNIQMSSATGG